MKRIAVTGATGMIGSALIQLCVEAGVEVYAFCRQNSKKIMYLPVNPLVHIIEINLEQLETLDVSKLHKCDVFYHLGWEATIGNDRNNCQLQMRNVQYTLDAVQLAAKMGCHTFVGAGSQAEYGLVEGSLDGNTPVQPRTAYGIAKLCAGQMSRLMCSELGMKHIWTRILSVYGPGDSQKTMISSLIKNLLEGKKPSLTEGVQMWDYLYCSDAAKALYLLGEKAKKTKIYCVGSGQAVKLLHYINVIRDKINPEAELGIGEIPYHKDSVMYLRADITELQEDVGFVPEVTFEEGIEKTIDWIRMVNVYEKN